MSARKQWSNHTTPDKTGWMARHATDVLRDLIVGIVGALFGFWLAIGYDDARREHDERASDLATLSSVVAELGENADVVDLDVTRLSQHRTGTTHGFYTSPMLPVSDIVLASVIVRPPPPLRSQPALYRRLFRVLIQERQLNATIAQYEQLRLEQLISGKPVVSGDYALNAIMRSQLELVRDALTKPDTLFTNGIFKVVYPHGP